MVFTEEKNVEILYPRTKNFYLYIEYLLILLNQSYILWRKSDKKNTWRTLGLILDYVILILWLPEFLNAKPGIYWFRYSCNDKTLFIWRIPENIHHCYYLGKWSCESCTYLNSADQKICEICSKSREPKTYRASLVESYEPKKVKIWF